MSAVFPHQAADYELSDETPWSTAYLCLTEGWTIGERLGGRDEPPSATERLRWHVERALEWIQQAAEGSLSVDGDRFELPWFPVASLGPPWIAFSEGTENFSTWISSYRAGAVDILQPSRSTLPLLATEFATLSGQAIAKARWGSKLLEQYPRHTNGAWLMLSRPPVLDPWKVPVTWSQLRQAIAGQGEDLDRLLSRTLENVRGSDPRILLIGFPIPEHIGGALKKIQWQGVALPPLVRPSELRGFRPTTESRWRYDRLRSFGDASRVAWIRSEDWSKSELSGRGALGTEWTQHRILLIGAGALGSVIAEILVRAGCVCVVIADSDTIAAGNLVRHTATLADVGRNKAEFLSERLGMLSPSTETESYAGKFPPADRVVASRFSDCDLVIDTTGNDDVLAAVARFEWGEREHRFVSLSLGRDARRLFVFMSRVSTALQDEFNEAFRPWSDIEANESASDPLPAEFIGCWHPLFPARVDDVWLMAAAAVKSIEGIWEDKTDPEMIVFEQVIDGTGFAGIRRSASPQ